ncbi:isotrichodermin C-15 hydroxylase [Myriangium duriaei CBS 260.36]|uniref:Isotrichodermin C-15 hydroxylase n=1 Tax=Myriangium duriaei CBS 260.36 TaxID=1168546 RepID=A0A9P4JBB8_9PEZI|nr:isotrichodermin C-15 hydroxylase [Myriangium duriaei CBS 260.36]
MDSVGVALPYLKAVIVLALLPVVATVLQRIFLHPLSKYPGPFLGKFTDLWAVYHGWKGDLAHNLERLHSKHGEFIRFGPNRISANSVEALENIYGFKANTRKSKWYYTFAIDPQRPSTHTVIDKGQHARKRRLVSQGLSTKSMKELEGPVIESIEVMCRQLLTSESASKDGWSDPKDMSAWSSYLTVDVMGAMVFSKRFGLMERTENRWIKDAVALASRNKYACGFMPWIITSGFDTILWPRLTDYRMRLKAFSMEQLKQRFARKNDDSLHDLFHFIMNAKDPETGESFTQQELGSEANLMVSAGGDTTSTAMASAFYFMTKYPETLEKATREIRSTFSSVESIRPGAELNSCTYLRGCMDESMRISPPVPSALMREALVGGVTINGHTFRAGTDLCVPAFAIHRNPKYYPDPLAFKPERWISSGGKDNKDESVRVAQSAFCPFSIGPRSCVGRAMGYMEMSVALARILWIMDFRRLPGDTLGQDHDGTYAMLDGFVAEKYGPMIQFRKRTDIKV